MFKVNVHVCLCIEDNVGVANHCEGMAKNFTTSGHQLFVQEGTSLTLVCKVQSNIVYWAYLDTVDILIANSWPVTTKDKAVTFSYVEASGNCLTTSATIPNINVLVGTPISCLADDDDTPTTNSTVVIRYTGEPAYSPYT